MKIYIVTFDDLENYGAGCANVKVFKTDKEAIDYIKTEYLKKCEVEEITEPMAEDSYDYQYGTTYAYIRDAYYWDMFEREIN